MSFILITQYSQEGKTCHASIMWTGQHGPLFRILCLPFFNEDTKKKNAFCLVIIL